MSDFAEIRDLMCRKLKQSSIPPRMLLSRFRFIDEKSRYSRACLDPNYLPFYFYLGRLFPRQSVLEIGFGLGLNGSLYMMGCSEVNDYLAIQEITNEYYSLRLGRANVKQVYNKTAGLYVGKLHDEIFMNRMRIHKWDVAIITEIRGYDTNVSWLSTVWDEMNDGGIICIDNTETEVVNKSYRDFCRIKGREPFIFPTRYGIGVIEK